jgi:hypothetical protein
MAVVVPPRRSTLSIFVIPFNPCNPSKLVDTFTLIGLSVLCPMLVFATAYELPTRRKSASGRVVR